MKLFRRRNSDSVHSRRLQDWILQDWTKTDEVAGWWTLQDLKLTNWDIGGRILAVRTKKHAQFLLPSLPKSRQDRDLTGDERFDWWCQQRNALQRHTFHSRPVYTQLTVGRPSLSTPAISVAP